MKTGSVIIAAWIMSEEIQNSCDIAATDYAENFRNEMAEKPFDRKMFDWLIEKVGDV